MERAVGALADDTAKLQVAAVDCATHKPRGLEFLFELERLVLRRGLGSGADAMPIDDIVGRHGAKARADIIIDFASNELHNAISEGRRVLTPLYNGAAGEDAILAAVVAGDLPEIEILDSQSGGIVAAGHPSAEDAAGLSGALDAVMARTVTLLARVLANDTCSHAGATATCVPRGQGSPAPYVLSGLASAVARRIYKLCCYGPHWRVGWRHVDDGGVWDRDDLSGPAWNVVPDPQIRFYADPFPITWEGRAFVFVEELDHRVGKGIISAIEFGENGPAGPARPALEENWHLSYPFLIEHGGSLWMIPESIGNREVAIYKCVGFPDRWERFATLLSDIRLSDATITRHNGLYYLFGTLWDGAGGYSDTLAIYYSTDLFGPWQPHAANPVLVDRSSARPAGNLVMRNGRLWRPAQDCSAGYGSGLALAEIVDLTPSSFRQVVRKTLKPDRFWPGRKLHTLNRAGRLEVIDGSRIQPKLTALASAWTH
ncbi:hypothetical protein [Bradyrhizobium sp. LHD-71]|uniref:glucosamine inositolphosphorylceramide transferase family protein n=1 Tax=Bradyrhizobium sp. LHD-71 TaxID=3072141 RepID=UPI00280D2260|nr:hypothetical protein [Bradyrhizobium sp. LHD-71]MDQ8726665.1 hypothetical protein [Bradyrhizobium sp. LHD-71]